MPDDRDDELIAKVPAAFAGLVAACRLADHEAIAVSVVELLNIATRLGRAPRQKADEALVRAISRL